MNKELQDLAWSLLPKEFKEEVKRKYKTALRFNEYAHECVVFRNLFGVHNLTSDAEGEEMLTVSRKEVLDEFHSAKIIASEKMSSKVLAGAADMYLKTLEHLFGSKCLPDEASPKEATSAESATTPEPAEPKNKDCDNHLAGVGKMMDRRLNIAATMAKAILTNPHEVYRAETCSKARDTPKAIAEYALALTDALLAGCGIERDNGKENIKLL